MMDWTDRHCRAFHRRFTRRTALYTEMVTTGAVLHGPRERLLAYDPSEHPITIQIGGSEPDAVAAAAAIGRDLGFDEINLNVGCPSDRVQAGCFGAALMRTPDLVADCAAAMIAAAGPVPVSVKCRIGVDDQDPETVLPAFLETVAAAGVRRFAIHARKAWLDGLSPRQNREIPPLDYGLARRMKARFPQLSIVLNGGVDGLDAAAAHLAAGFDGVMIGRAAYQRPALLGAADRVIFGDPRPGRRRGDGGARHAVLHRGGAGPRGRAAPDHSAHARRLRRPPRRARLAAHPLRWRASARGRARVGRACAHGGGGRPGGGRAVGLRRSSGQRFRFGGPKTP